MTSSATPAASAGAPFDNASVAARLLELPFVENARALTVSTSGGEFAGFKATPARPDPRLGDALLLHGWPEYASCWEKTAGLLLEQGMSVFAYDQRGYSPGARPESVDEYTMPHLVADLDEISRSVGLGRFHLVGHDWGGMVAWHYAANHPERLLTNTVVSTPHPIAHAKQVQADPDQYERMEYMRAIQDHPDGVARTLLRNNAERLIALYAGDVPDDMAASYAARLSEPGAMDSVLKYYQAADGRARLSSTPVIVPTTFVWGSEDIAFPRATAELTVEYVEGPYRFVPLEGASHWLPESHPAEIAREAIAVAREHSSS
ncbi:alpha/beta hydrolase [Brevibacterium sp. RIT 803]|uniref:alpha/beta fold hydrolase n=1 Tax=Brevibacterium sp. RIT 803 TaxID=2810210 RepID=UPI0019522033|nr:alpha/beta hydrolase [Brevibacterium sp. RIT 803]MBM6590540.1 alpha/beta hydrolase [Brevibacterium sp. RIT 803]